MELPSSSSSFWPHTWENDPRSPLWTVSVAGTVHAIYFPSVFMVVELLGWLLGGTCAAALFSPLIYMTLVTPRRRRQEKQRSQSQESGQKQTQQIEQLPPPLPTTTACLWTFGFFLPFWIFLPVQVVDALHCSNQLFRFAACVMTPTCSIFRITEALFGYVPPQEAGSSMAQYALYFATPGMFEVQDGKATDNHESDAATSTMKYIPSTPSFLLELFARFATCVFLSGVLNSCFRLLSPTYFPTFGSSVEIAYGDEEWYSFAAIFNLRRQRDSILYALLFQLTLATSGLGLQLICSLLTGRQTQALMQNPMLLSKSVSEFWARRWNTLIHECLKNGVYKPVRFSLRAGPLVAVLAAFLASGLFHEWVLMCVFSKLDSQSRRHGGALVFFLWQAGLIVIEQQLERLASYSSLQTKGAKSTSDFPVVVVMMVLLGKVGQVVGQFPVVCSFLVVLAGLPMSHWFSESYVKSDLFLHAQINLPMIVPLLATNATTAIQ